MADIPYVTTPRPELQATGGGQGSFSYADTKVYGPRQPRQPYYNVQRTYDTATGLILSELIIPTSVFVIPGSGGGAKAPGKRYYGSRATGFKPQGLVLLRLMKLE